MANGSQTSKIATRAASGAAGGLTAVVVRSALVACGFAVGGPVLAVVTGAVAMVVSSAVNDALAE